MDILNSNTSLSNQIQIFFVKSKNDQYFKDPSTSINN